MEIIYDISDIDGNHHGRFPHLKDAKIEAVEIANHLKKEIFIEQTKKITIDSIKPK
ncbi:hypothetical protein LCM23_12875 [Cytobacillus kochii]|uniref:hypothetical protein n=1 Tax=Cytobacillus kochii TaxID=859143 RepID=UPI001CD53EF5|nr:hypothetical protein [Cytobacillus kochii]MCA1026987.1 hypothetical protein [Cytobacillus kochii]